MDKNIAALLRNDARTVAVKFFPFDSGKTYTYVTTETLSKGDLVIVGVNRDSANKRDFTLLGSDTMESIEYCVCLVVDAHAELRIAPDESIKYKWVIGKIDMHKYHKEVVEKNTAITDLVSNAYKKNIRNQFMGLLIGSMDTEAAKQLEELTSAK